MEELGENARRTALVSGDHRNTPRPGSSWILAEVAEWTGFRIPSASAALWLTQAVAPYLRERGSGSIVHVAARPGLEPTAGMATYSVSKAALVHVIRVLDL